MQHVCYIRTKEYKFAQIEKKKSTVLNARDIDTQFKNVTSRTGKKITASTAGK